MNVQLLNREFDKNMKEILSLIMLVFSFLSIQAQTTIEGNVVDAKGKAIEGYVTVSPKSETRILGYAKVNERGYYKLVFSSEADSIKVTASGLAIGNVVKYIKNLSQKLDFNVQEKALQLKEVVVKADKIRQAGDTINYLVDAYQQQSDRTIGDVLKRMPGIEVSESGGIKFNGKEVSSFYVEDMDLLQGRYGLATNNISASAVATVQIEQNHQPIKALFGKALSDNVSLNLKLKNSVKGTLSINSMLGGGVQEAEKPTIGRNPLWKAELVAMFFSKKRQNMTLYKGNNTGEDVSSELTSHYTLLNGSKLYPFCPTNAILPSGSGLPQRRTFDNSSHIFSVNHLEKLDKDTEMGINISYYNDKVRRQEVSTSSLFVDNGSRIQTEEILSSETKTDNLSFSARFNRNASNGFFANVLKLEGMWNSDNVESVLNSEQTGTHPEIYGNHQVWQHFHRPEYTMSNTTNFIRNFGKNTLDLHLFVGYAQRPNMLSVDVDSLLQGTRTTYNQEVASHHIVGEFHTKYDYRIKSFSLQYRLMTHASLHGIKTDLKGFTPPADTAVESPLQNDLWYNTYEVMLGQLYQFVKSGWRLSLDCPLVLYTQTLDDRLRKSKDSYTHLLVTPMFSAGYEWRDWSGNMNFGYSKTVGDPGGIYNGFIMNNYRSFQRSYVDQLSETDRIDTKVTVAYRNALHALFLNLNAGYTYTRDNQTYGYSYQDATSVVQAIDQGTTSDNYSVNVNVSKGFDWLQCTVRAFGGYRYVKKELLVQQQIHPFHSQAVSAGMGFTITPLSWLNLVLTSGYSWTKSQTNNVQDRQSRDLCMATQRVKMNTYITKRITLTATLEDNYNNLTDTNRHCWFGDMLAEYRLKHVVLAIQLNNLFNQQQYTNVSNSGLDIFSSTSQLRSRHILATVRFKLL